MNNQIRKMSFKELQKNRNQVFKHILIHLGLEEMWEYVCKNNTSHSSANYHSTAHMREMTTIAYWLLGHNYHEEAFNSPDAIWAHDQCKAMVAACLIHDMNHSLGHQDDDYNILQAIDALIAMMKRNPFALTFLSVHGHMVAETERNIRITRFPYSDDMRPNTIYQKCIRDADILYSMQRHAAAEVVDNLRLEMGVRFDKYRTCTRDQFIDDRMPFIKTCEMFTPAGRAIMIADVETSAHEEHLRQYVRDLEHAQKMMAMIAERGVEDSK